MNILCSWLGHKFVDENREIVTTQRFFGSSANPIGPPVQEFRVSIKCQRCGYEHARSEALDGELTDRRTPEQAE